MSLFARPGMGRGVSPRTVLCAALVALVTGACTGARPTHEPEPPPNILLVITDDQRVGTLRVMPATRRWFKQGGTSFTQAFATTPQCCPSRASIFSGQYAHNHGVLTNDDASELDSSSLFTRALRGEGYTTAIVGKYLNYPGGFNNQANVSIDPPHFDDWASFLGGYDDSLFNVGGKLRAADYSTTFIKQQAVDALRGFEAAESRPWFLVVAPFAPHPHYEPQPKYEDAPVPRWSPSPASRERNRADKPPFVRLGSPLPLSRAQKIRGEQLRTLMSVDDLVERVARSLGKLGEKRRTLALFVSDNGFSWGEHGLEGKGTAYTESVRIPLLMSWPGHVGGGAVDDRLVANIDLPATILDAGGIVPPEYLNLDGFSLLSDQRRQRLLLEHWGLEEDGLSSWASIRTKRAQLVEYYGEDGNVETWEYYDLAADPWQLTNLLGNHGRAGDIPEAQALAEQLAKDRRCAGESCP